MRIAELVRPQPRGDDRTAATAGTVTAKGPAAERREDADGMAVAAFVLGLVGLLVMNIALGPAAVVLAALALRRGTARRGRALLGLTLGVADLVVLAVLVTLDGTVVWSLGG
ncbi:hypothetical protein [Streptomyces peucetius]|uniref:DUF4190 domain-containing protein n=1 Tax=Streptomyces peucetius TaxID=1950 RepID=A0ABY6IC36_STRPE|nr:hypothetical protein [Streptomyces peucetius]UYQ64553.1 hypothetical protein OGH68_25900 [Streptomyces peucetius]